MSGRFKLSKRELSDRVAAIMHSKDVGYTLRLERSVKSTSQAPARTPIAAARMLQMLEDFEGDDVFVEEQDRSYYIIHLDADDKF